MVVIEQLLSAQEVGDFRARLADAPWQDGCRTAEGMAADVKNNGQADPADAGVRALANALLARLGQNPRFTAAALPQRIFPPCFNRYGEGETYGFHVDAAIMRIPGTQDVLRSDVSGTVFLSDPDEYDGGELVIQTHYGEQALKLPAGSMVVYPSSSLHRVTPVTRGQRLAAITWLQSMVPGAETRATLFELDLAIQSLLAAGTATREQLDALHHVYHNLIRQHAQL
ncbi:Fe2+-dependent dioxygenase [Mangrovimicrobium sediminis]|uniref:Fe2+-dependent dioxygenase n=1 Tax=Mangrovimicrobium sediminis TaxID=2562682 RepID=A0A4Z0LVD5_9GAMM|nr:Fe2+-dependent dioxygenase [Haliea sp. SAOS-164]TGD71088.1 Fe2+-dependent dioxygenase [Haliea sp. SAOS-164]